MKSVGIFALLIITFIYSKWFTFGGTLSSGDWPYLFLENIKEFSFLPEAKYLWLAPYYQIPTKLLVQYAGVSWEVSERILWFFPFVIVSIISSYYLTRSWIGVLIYTTNTYVLMLVGGGQMGIAMAYSVAPFVLGRFIKLIDSVFSSKQNLKSQSASWRTNLKSSIINGLILAILAVFDPRVAYICFVAIATYIILHLLYVKRNILHTSLFYLYTFAIPIGITIVLNSYWTVSVYLHGLPEEVRNYGSAAGLEYLSFASFSNSFSLLHPNWSENIFGKTYFMRAEFLILPILAYSSLLFLNRSNIKDQISKIHIKNKKFYSSSERERVEKFSMDSSRQARTVIYFCLLVLIGAFLAKGANPPFGEINLWMFEYLPGFSIFRDPTKFYVLVALSCSVLIPFSLSRISKWLQIALKNSKLEIINSKQHQNSKFKILINKTIEQLNNLAIVFFIIYLIFLIRPAFFGQLGGTFKSHVVPEEYIRLKDFLHDEPKFFKTLWIPERQRFGFSSKDHPAISGNIFFAITSASMIVDKINEKSQKELIKQSSIKYVVVPFDSEKEIFLKDRKYNEKVRQSLVGELRKVEWLREVEGFKEVNVFEVL